MYKSKVIPKDKDDIVNKDYVDNRHKIVSYSDYMKMGEEKNSDGIAYFVPDIPIDTSGKVIGDVEYGDFFSSDIKGSSLSIGCIIDFNQKTSGNLTYDNGVKLNKGKFYLVYCNIAYLRNEEGNSHLRFEVRINGNQIWATNGISIASGSTSAWSDGALMIHYKCTGDNDLLTINCVSVAGVDTILGGLSKLIITEIPSYTGLLDCSDDHIKEVANTDRNLKTYTTLSQIGLTTGCTISDILNALTDYSQIVVNSSYINNTDRPLNSPADELITITRLWHSRITIISTDRNGKICTGLTSYSGTTVTFDGWKIICDTKVTDIPITQLTFNNTTNYTENNSGMHSHYRVKNGICYVGLDVICTTPKTGNWSYVFSDGSLPLPELDKARYFTMGGEDGKSNINGIVDNLGRIGLMFGNSGVRYVTSLSYPVSES